MTPGKTDTVSADAAMKQYGIIRVPTEHYLYNEYRYSKLDDAIAQAERHGHLSRQR